MDISSLSGLSADATASKISYAVARKTLDANKAEGQELVKLIDAASEQADVDADADTGSGSGGVDTYA